MNTEVELLQLRDGSNEKSYQDIDDLMFEEFAKKADGNLLDQICKLWKDEQNEDESLVRNKSDYTPPRSVNLTLDKYCEYITDFPYEIIQHPRIKSNLKKTDWNIISDLQNNKNIVKKEADKGSAVVIMGTDYYKNLILKYTYYESVANYKQQKIIAKLIVLVNLYRKGLTKKECDYITNFKCKTSQIYGLPKIHKSQKITEACKLAKVLV
ncbi:unnamed protein product [Mytilus coruscus]|uniref:Uncharacterized protein n=1 Tax=Mytilus coruscus TaxID=42192 RepID=A0A6J8AQ40_MYTCO|nr:unnamed protein product [Mytilus coruscus]